MTETTSQPNAIELLTTDHAAVEQMFRQIESLPEGDARSELVAGVVRELSVHAAIEEQVLYPAMRKALPDARRAFGQRSNLTSSRACTYKTHDQSANVRTYSGPVSRAIRTGNPFAPAPLTAQMWTDAAISPTSVFDDPRS